MSALSKIGSLILKGVSIISGIAPFVNPKASQAVGVVSRDLEQIAGIIAQVEVVGQALSIKGPEKLKAAGPLVAQVILSSSLLVGHKIGDPSLFAEGSSDIANGIAKVLNSLKDNGIQEDSKV